MDMIIHYKTLNLIKVSWNCTFRDNFYCSLSWHEKSNLITQYNVNSHKVSNRYDLMIRANQGCFTKVKEEISEFQA